MRSVIDHSSLFYWQCDWHGAVRVRQTELHNDQSPFNVLFVVLYKNDTYHATFFRNYNLLSNLPKFRIDKINRNSKLSQVIITLNFYPDITPENVASKLPTYILFS